MKSADEILAYNKRLGKVDQAICTVLAKTIDRHLPTAERKIWHGAPVWFLDGNPIVGYSKRKVGVTLLFWSGQSFKAKGLQPEGSFKAAEMKYTNATEVDTAQLGRWLKDAKTIQWDYKNIIKRRGKLVRIKP